MTHDSCDTHLRKIWLNFWMEAVVKQIQTSLNFSTCEITSRPKGGIVNAGKAAVVKGDDAYYFIKHNNTSLV